ncbi:MAG TPA: hypothetical protein VHL58_15190 [Thermoanaerobaculia bacterium]|nr:hypothetical protein [Thermoanaerobaculia bacterium]
MNRTTMRVALAAMTALSISPSSEAASTKSLQVNVSQVNDRRSSGSFSQLSIFLELPTVLSTDLAASRVILKAAEDDKGKNLLDTSAGEPRLETNRQGSFGPDDKKVSPASVSFELKNPDRQATRVKEIRGEVELFMPAKDANSVALIPKFLSSSGKSLSHKALKANGVEIAIVSKAQLDAERKKVGDKRREEAKAQGSEGEDLESAVTNAMENFFTPDAGDVVLKVKDPNHHIQDISFIDKGGEVKPGNAHDVEGWTIVSRYGEPPAADWGLRISMQTEKNILRYPFVLTDVPLP